MEDVGGDSMRKVYLLWDTEEHIFLGIYANKERAEKELKQHLEQVGDDAEYYCISEEEVIEE